MKKCDRLPTLRREYPSTFLAKQYGCLSKLGGGLLLQLLDNDTLKTHLPRFLCVHVRTPYIQSRSKMAPLFSLLTQMAIVVV